MGTLSRSWSRERRPNLTMYALSIASLEQRSGQNIMIEVEVSRNSGNILLIYDDDKKPFLAGVSMSQHHFCRFC